MLLATPALADEDDAQKLFKEAQEHFDGARYEQALELSRKAHTATQSPNARLYVARSLKGLGRFDEAYEEMTLTLDDAAAKADAEPKYIATRDAAAAELALLKQKIGKVIVAIVEPPPGVVVKVNGNAIAPDRIGNPLAVLPGDSIIVVEAEGHERYERTIQIGAGSASTVAVRLIKLSDDVPAPTPPPVDPGPRQSGGLSKTWGYVGLGVGAVGLTTFTIFALSAKSTHDQLEEDCGGRCTDPKFQDDVDSGKRAQTIANIGLGVGVIGVAAGVTVLLLGGSAKEPPPAAAFHWNRGPSLSYSRRF
jgi:hypothetical protein